MRAATVSLLTLLLLVVAVPGVAQEATRCAALFPEAEWDTVAGHTIDIGATGVPQGRLDRFVAEIEKSASAIAAEIGGLEASAVCLVDPSSGFVPQGYIPPTERFHAVLDGPNDVLLLSTESVGAVNPAAAWAVAHLALWNQSGGEGWPEPLATAVAHWYRARALDRLELYHQQAMGLDYGGDYEIDLTTDPRIEWTESAQPAVRVWDPADVESSIGDFIEYTTTNEGTAVLLDTDPAAWTEREGAWRTALVADLTGRTEPTSGWKIGITIAVVLVLFAGAVAFAGFRAKRRANRKSATPPPIPGFFAPAEEGPARDAATHR